MDVLRRCPQRVRGGAARDCNCHRADAPTERCGFAPPVPLRWVWIAHRSSTYQSTEQLSGRDLLFAHCLGAQSACLRRMDEQEFWLFATAAAHGVHTLDTWMNKELHEDRGGRCLRTPPSQTVLGISSGANCAGRSMTVHPCNPPRREVVIANLDKPQERHEITRRFVHRPKTSFRSTPAHSSDPQAADIPGTGVYQSHTTCTCSWRTPTPFSLSALPRSLSSSGSPHSSTRRHTTRARPSGALSRSVPSFARSLGVHNRTNSTTSAEHPPCRFQAPERCGSGCVELCLGHSACLPGPVSQPPGLPRRAAHESPHPRPWPRLPFRRLPSPLRFCSPFAGYAPSPPSPR